MRAAKCLESPETNLFRHKLRPRIKERGNSGNDGRVTELVSLGKLIAGACHERACADDQPTGAKVSRVNVMIRLLLK
jgi:hypothetical protein